MGIFTAGGAINTTTVVGNTYTGMYAADGSINIVVDDASHVGIYHPCGAFRVNSGTSTKTFDPTGAFFSNNVLGAR